MKRHYLFLLGVIFSLSQACTNSTKQQILQDQEVVDSIHTSQNSIDWHGRYEGTIPCADCPGIKTSIILGIDETFIYEDEYLDRNVKTNTSGRIMWHDNGSVIHLHTDSIDIKYKVGENKLVQLDANGKEITGELASNYQLVKVE